MRCNQCGHDVADDAAFCPFCGERMAVTPLSPKPGSADDMPQIESLATSAAEPPHPAAATERIQQEQTRFGSKDPQEEDLWSGSFSPKAMLGHFMLAGFITVASLIGVAVAWNTVTGWLCFVAGVVLLWGTAGITLAYRRMTARYRLTRFRLFHEHGILTRVTDRIETIDIDDVTVFQGLADRSFGIGMIVVVSTDRTSPELRMRGIDHVKAVADLMDSTRRAERQRRGLHLEST